MLKIINLQTDGGNFAPNQFVIFTNEGRWFQSYTSMIAFVPKGGGIVQLGEDYDYSRTTMKYLCKFLGLGSINDVREMLENGRAVEADLDKSFGREKPYIEVPISEGDLDMFDNLVTRNEEFSWSFPDQYKNAVEIRFVQEKE